MSNLNTQQTVSQNPSRSMTRLVSTFALGLVALGSVTAAQAGPFDGGRASKVGSKVPSKAAGKAQDVAQKVDKILESIPNPKKILGVAKDTIDEGIGDTVGQLRDMQSDLKRFKGNGCSTRDRSDCAELKSRLKGIYVNMRGLRDIVPGYDFLPYPSEVGIDPLGDMIEKIPAAPLYGMSKLFANLTVLDDLEMISVWLEQLRFYSIDPVEEDLFYRLPVEECQTLENSILADNEIFDRMKKVMSVTATISDMAVDILPKDIVLNATVGTSIPNPILPVMVLSKRMSTDFNKVLEQELEERGKLVKKCRTQQFRNDTQYKLDTLLGW